MAPRKAGAYTTEASGTTEIEAPKLVGLPLTKFQVLPTFSQWSYPVWPLPVDGGPKMPSPTVAPDPTFPPENCTDHVKFWGTVKDVPKKKRKIHSATGYVPH